MLQNVDIHIYIYIYIYLYFRILSMYVYIYIHMYVHHAVLLLMHAHLKGATLHGQETVPQPLGLLCPHVSPPTTKECTMYIINIYIYAKPEV